MSSPPRTPLILVGASVRAAAFSAWRGGFAPWALDQFADADLAELCPVRRVDDHPSSVLDAFPSAPQAPWMYTGGVENHPELVLALSELRTLLGNDAPTLRRVRDPLQLADALSAAGWPTLDVRSGTQPPCRGIWMRKPLRSGGGRGIRQVDADRASLEASAAVYFQQSLPLSAPVYGATYVMAAGDSRLLGVCRQYSGFKHVESAASFASFLYRGSATVDITGRPLVELRRLGELLARSFPLRGVVGVDVVRHEDAWWVLEVNPRFPASCELLDPGLPRSVVAFHVAACAAGRLPQDASTATFTARAKWIVYACEDLVWNAALSRWWKEAAARRSGEGPILADVPASDTVIAAGHPLCTLLVDGDYGDEAALALHAAEQQVLAAVRAAQST